MKVMQVQIQFKSGMHDFHTPAASAREKCKPAEEALLRKQRTM
jgi:hypothetical protein